MTKKKLLDKLLLILTGFSILFFYFIADITLSRIFAKEWVNFIVASIIYIIMLAYGTFVFENFKQIAKKKLFLYQSVFYAFTVGSAYLIFKYKLLPMPQSHHIYVIGIVILAISSVVLLGYLVKRIEFFRDDKKKIQK